MWMDVLEVGLAEIGYIESEPRSLLTIGVFGKTKRARVGCPFQSRGDIDAVPHKIAVVLLDDIAQMDAHPELDATFRRQTGIALEHAGLHLDGAANGVHHAAELDENAIAGALNDAAMSNAEGRLDRLEGGIPDLQA